MSSIYLFIFLFLHFRICRSVYCLIFSKNNIVYMFFIETSLPRDLCCDKNVWRNCSFCLNSGCNSAKSNHM